jgi:hypothetical protein
MGRTATLISVLAALAAVTAYASTASTPRTHRRAATTHPVYHASSKSHRSGSVAAEHHVAAARRTAVRAHPPTPERVHRPTPEEVGRAAGLKIREQLAQESSYRQSPTHRTTYRRTRSREAARYRHPRAVRASLRGPLHTAGSEPARFERDTESARQPEPHEAAREVQPEAADAQPSPAPDRPAPDDPAIDQPADEAGAGRETAYRSPDGSVPPAIGTPAQARPSAGPALPAQPAPGEANAEEESTEDLAPETSPNPSDDTEEASLVIPHGAMPAPLRGSLASLERQNARLEAEGLERIEDEADLAQRIADGLLVPVPVSSGLTVNEDLPLNHRYCRPWTARFLADLARAHEAAFHRPLEVSSAVRTVEYQERLMHINGNAAPAEGDIVSPHLTGATIDIAKKGLTRDEIGWMRRRLLDLQTEGKIDVEEEFRQACFHITVYKTYDAPRTLHRPSEAKEPQAAPAADGDSSPSGF